MSNPFSVGINSPATIHISLSDKKIQNIPCKIIATGIKIPGIPSYSSYYNIAWYAPVLISLKQMQEIIHMEMEADHNIKTHLTNSPAFSMTPDGVRKKCLYIKFFDEVPFDTKEVIYFQIKNLIDGETTNIMLVEDIMKATIKVRKIIEYFFIVVGLIALILSFFLIWTTFYCNIKDNICEYGIMRSIGISIAQSTRIYLYEASTIIISAIIAGTLVGIVIAFTLILQFNHFSELPFQPDFPYKLYLTLVVVGLGLGLLGSYYPTHEVNKLSLVKIMKGIL
jgi:ABC-type antimicrobial peptide transport system permease subunit